MYAINNGQRYNDINRIEVRGVHEVLLQGIGTELHGLIDIFCEDGFHLCTEDTANYARAIITGNALVLTDRPEPTPQPEPDPEPEYIEDEQLSERIEELEAKNEMLEECLIELANIIFA